MNDFILIPNPLTGLIKLLDALGRMTFGEYLIGIGVIMGCIVLWGLFSMIYLMVWPDLPEPSSHSRPHDGFDPQTAERTEGGA